MKRIAIIDGYSLIFRAFYAMQRPMITSEGIYTQGIYGFLNMLNKIQEDFSPEYMAVAFDLKEPTFRHRMFSEYKGTRKPMPEELHEQVPVIKKVLGAMNIPILTKPGYEADDILGTAAKRRWKTPPAPTRRWHRRLPLWPPTPSSSPVPIR